MNWVNVLVCIGFSWREYSLKFSLSFHIHIHTTLSPAKNFKLDSRQVVVELSTHCMNKSILYECVVMNLYNYIPSLYCKLVKQSVIYIMEEALCMEFNTAFCYIYIYSSAGLRTRIGWPDVMIYIYICALREWLRFVWSNILSYRAIVVSQFCHTL